MTGSWECCDCDYGGMPLRGSTRYSCPSCLHVRCQTCIVSGRHASVSGPDHAPYPAHCKFFLPSPVPIPSYNSPFHRNTYHKTLAHVDLSYGQPPPPNRAAPSRLEPQARESPFPSPTCRMAKARSWNSLQHHVPAHRHGSPIRTSIGPCPPPRGVHRDLQQRAPNPSPPQLLSRARPGPVRVGLVAVLRVRGAQQPDALPGSVLRVRAVPVSRVPDVADREEPREQGR